MLPNPTDDAENYGTLPLMIRWSMRVLAALLLYPISALAAIPSPDASFYQKAAEYNLEEIDGGRLAPQQANDSAVRSFGTTLGKDHGTANRTLRGLAMMSHVDFPGAASDETFFAKRAMLLTLTGDAFDRYFVEWQISLHQEMISLFKQEIESGLDPDAKNYASSNLPMLQDHLELLLSLH